MEFSSDKPIYRQIVDYACCRVMGGEWSPGGGVPSVRELSAALGVNSRTVLKAFDDLQEEGIIIPRRGMGVILAEDAPQRIMAKRRQEFFDTTIPAIREEMERLGITSAELIEALNKG